MAQQALLQLHINVIKYTKLGHLKVKLNHLFISNQENPGAIPTKLANAPRTAVHGSPTLRVNGGRMTVKHITSCLGYRP